MSRSSPKLTVDMNAPEYIYFSGDKVLLLYCIGYIIPYTIRKTKSSGRKILKEVKLKLILKIQKQM